MARPLPLDLRQRVIGAVNVRQSCGAAAARFGIAPSVAVTWHRLWRKTGSVAPRAQGGDKRSRRLEALGPAIFAMVEAAVHITPAEIAEWLEAEYGERFAPSTVHRFFRRHGRTFNKVGPCRRAGACRRRLGARPGSRRCRNRTPNA